MSNLKKSVIPEKMIDPKKQTLTGCHAILNGFNKFSVSVFNASDNFFIDFTDNELNEVEISIGIAKDALNASSGGFGPDLIPSQVWRKSSNNISIHFYNLVSSIGEAVVYPTSWKQHFITLFLKDGPKDEIIKFLPTSSLSKLSLANEKIIYATVSKHLENNLSSHQFDFRQS